MKSKKRLRIPRALKQQAILLAKSGHLHAKAIAMMTGIPYGTWRMILSRKRRGLKW